MYSRELCKAILRGMRRQLKDLNLVSNGCYGMQHHGFEEPDICAVNIAPEGKISGRFRDDITGQLLQDDLVSEARRKELEYFEQKCVWEKISRGKAKAWDAGQSQPDGWM